MTILASTVTVKTMADDTLRLTIDIEPRHAQEAFALFGQRGMPCKAERFGTVKVGDVPPKSELHGAFSVQVGGGHYKSMAIQPAEYCHRNRIGKLEGDVIAYVSRWRAKNGVEDLKKARHTLDLMIEMEEVAAVEHKA